MKKKIILLAAALMLFMGVVHASSINGDYKGNPIVKVMSNGKLLQSDEVPAQIYDGHTVVPISLLRQLGASVEWNQETYSVDVKLPQSASQNASVNLLKVRYDLLDEVSTVDYSIDENGVSKLTFALKFNSGSGSDDKYNKVVNIGAATGVDRLSLIDEKQDGYITSYRTVNLRDFVDKKISAEEFKSKIEIQPKLQQTSSQPVQQNQSPIQQPQNNNQNLGQYTLSDAVIELGFPDSASMTVDARSLAIELVEIRKTKKQSDYSIQDALVDLGIPQGSRPTLATLKQAVKLISVKQPVQPQTYDGSNVQNGENGVFQFIGVSDFFDNIGTLHITGQVKNTTGKTMIGGVEVTVTLFNQNGNVVSVQSGYAYGASTLKDGDTASFDIPFFNYPTSYTRYEVKAKS